MVPVGDRRWLLIGAIAPIAWGSTYVVVSQVLPDTALWGATFRALPAGLLLLALARSLPRGSWWWKSFVLGFLNCGAFFVLVYVAGQLLPSSIAAMIMSLAPLLMMLLAWAVVGERLVLNRVLGGIVGVLGVVLLLGGASGAIDQRGVLASFSAMAMSSLGFVLVKRWGAPGNVLASTSWQLTAGGLMLLPIAAIVDGAPPALTWSTAAGFLYLSVVATAIASLAWFGALSRLPAGSVGLIGLLNPVTGVVLGLLVADESLRAWQVVGLVVVFAGLVLGQTTRSPKQDPRVVPVA